MSAKLKKLFEKLSNLSLEGFVSIYKDIMAKKCPLSSVQRKFVKDTIALNIKKGNLTPDLQIVKKTDIPDSEKNNWSFTKPKNNSTDGKTEE